ncbi:MAG TPA: hypothetical protein PL124_00240 [Candidatus Cloacimonadota bacterium]|nr:hypothetical protein [Candidatus Cloacimonadota bacterium]
MAIFKPSFTKEQLSRILDMELCSYPLAQLDDLYKLIYQAITGPSHMPHSHSLIKKALFAELNAARMLPVPFSYDIGTGIGYQRISLCWLSDLDGRKQEEAIDEFVRIINGSRLSEPYSSKDIELVWSQVIPLIKTRLPLTESDTKRISDMIIQELIPSHSDIYKSVYQPHYRLVHQSLLDETYDLINSTIEE